MAGSNALVDAELLKACRSGDPGAFEELVRRTQHRVYALAYRLVGDRGEAEDVAQEAYLRVFRSLGGFRQEARFETWLHRIVVNAALSHLRRRGRFGDLVRDAGTDPEPPPAPPAQDRAVDRDLIRRALEELPAGSRTTLVLYEMYGLSCREIGEELGVSEGAVKVRLHRARRRLKEAIHGASEHAV